MTRLIGLYSPAPQSGKSTVAGYLAAQGFITVSFAAPLRAMVRELLMALGHDGLEAARLLNTAKAEQIPGIRCTARHLLQTIGTDWGRQHVHPDVWVMAASNRIRQARGAGYSVVVDDCRFPNEAQLIRELGGELWRIERPSAADATGHVSEGGLEDPALFRHVITNDGTTEQLKQAILQAVTTTTPNAERR